MFCWLLLLVVYIDAKSLIYNLECRGGRGNSLYGTFQVGTFSQKVTLLLDTGSPSSWIKRNSISDSFQFKTWNGWLGSHFSTVFETGAYYGGGGLYHGFYVSDTFELVGNVDFDLATKCVNVNLDNSSADGYLSNDVLSQICKGHGLEDQFTVYFMNEYDRRAYLVLGDYDNYILEKYTNSVTLPVINQTSHLWLISSPKFTIRGIIEATPVKVLFDTGFDSIILNQRRLNFTWNVGNENGEIANCNKTNLLLTSQLPVFELVLGNVTFTIGPQVYIEQIGNRCRLMIGSKDLSILDDKDIVLGLPFFRFFPVAHVSENSNHLRYIKVFF